jgi:hypothetical protein
MQKLWLYQQYFYFFTIKYIYGSGRYEKCGIKINERRNKWLEREEDVFQPIGPSQICPFAIYHTFLPRH